MTTVRPGRSANGKDPPAIVNQRDQGMVNKWIEIAQRLLMPHRCVVCGAPGAGRDLCKRCESALPWLGAACPLCALPADGVCGSCLRHPPPWKRQHALFRYEPPVSRLIHDLKFGSRLQNARLLGGMLAEEVERRGCAAEGVMGVPLHPRRQRQRGFNQAHELARVVAARLRLPLLTRRCERLRWTTPQSTLARRQRAANLRHAFRCGGRLPSRLLLVDDVVTTGGTVDAVTRSLLEAGADSIEVWSLCRALPAGER